jgi:hypothetical protein
MERRAIFRDDRDRARVALEVLPGRPAARGIPQGGPQLRHGDPVAGRQGGGHLSRRKRREKSRDRLPVLADLAQRGLQLRQERLEQPGLGPDDMGRDRQLGALEDPPQRRGVLGPQPVASGEAPPLGRRRSFNAS